MAGVKAGSTPPVLDRPRRPLEQGRASAPDPDEGPANGYGYRFPGNAEGKPLLEIKKGWAVISKAANIRHTCASHLVSAGVSLPVVGNLRRYRPRPGTPT